MGAKKGTLPPNAGKGRIAGVPNKATANARQAIAAFVDANTPRLQGWLDEIASDPKQGPFAAFKCVMELCEYHVPKLQRTELTGKDGGPVRVAAVVDELHPETTAVDLGRHEAARLDSGQ